MLQESALELYLGRCFLRWHGFEERFALEPEKAGKQYVWEHFGAGVVASDGVVVRLTRESDAIFCCGQLGLELKKVGVGLDVGVRLGDGE